jgi:Tfp pilus assembly major pilin PilA
MRQIGITALFTLLAVVGCSGDSSDPEGTANVELWQDELPIRDPWLRDQLPDDALMYWRTPDLFGLFATPKGNVMDSALRSRVNVENVQKIRAGVNDNVLAMIPMLGDTQLMLFARHVRSPVEVAGTFLPAPSALVGVSLDVDSNADFETLVNELGYSFAAPLDARGAGELLGTGVPAFARFDATNGRLLVHAGPGANAQRFDELLDGMQRDTPHQMRGMENRVDASGHGLFVWMNAQEALPAMQMFVPMDQYQQMIDAGLEKVDSIAVGWGVANGKSRLSLVADITRDRDFLPVISNPLSARSVGDPDGLLLVSIPDADYFDSLMTSPLWNDEDRANWQELNDSLRDIGGITVNELLSALGPEIMLILDRAGDYGAVRLRDPDLFDDIMERIASATGSSPDRVQRGGKTYFHWSTPSELAFLEEVSAGEMGWFGDLLSRPRDHYYWERTNDYLYIAATPQVLFDRTTLGADTEVGQWLENKQRIDGSNALFSFSGTSRKLPGRLYSLYIELTHLLADIAVADIDVWSMPTPVELGLPERGTLGLTIALGDPTIAMEMTFENNPAEMLGGMGGVATIGVLAAIAIPAYADYTTRAQISTGLSLSAGQKAAVTERYLSDGRFPNASEAEEISMIGSVSEYVSAITIEPDTGVLFVDYDQSVAGGGRLIMEPSVANGSVTWTCYTTFSDKLVPAACRR